ncbi:TPA: hypothetical protein ACXNP2_000075 [Stenotrophomonas maltophilia]
MSRIYRNRKWGLVGLSLVAFSVVAATISITAEAGMYKKVPSAQGLTAYDLAELRIAGMSGLAGMYRGQHGFASTPIGTRIKVTWGDGSTEEGVVECTTGSSCVFPIPGTQKPKPGGGGGIGSGSGGNGGGSGGGGGGGGGGSGGGGGGVVTVGPPKNVD